MQEPTKLEVGDIVMVDRPFLDLQENDLGHVVAIDKYWTVVRIWCGKREYNCTGYSFVYDYGLTKLAPIEECAHE